MLTFCDIQVKEVTIQNSLNDTGKNCDQIIEALAVVSIYPIQNVKTTISSQAKQIVTCY